MPGLRPGSSLVLATLLAACSPRPADETDAPVSVDTDDPPDLAPTAARTDLVVHVGEDVTLSAAGSADPEGEPLSFAWTLRLSPALSHAALDRTDAETTTFRADREGVYAVDLVVSDGEQSSAAATSLVTAVSTDDAPTANAGQDGRVTVGATASASGADSTDPNGLPLLYDWHLVEAPPGSAASLTAATEVITSFVPDLVGDYTLELVVDNGSEASEPDQVVFTAIEWPVVVDDVPNGVFDPDEVYIAGTLTEGACYLDAMAHWASPDVAAVGFDCYCDQGSAKIRSDGTMLYTNSTEYGVREFHCDGCDAWEPGDPYPTSPLANDTALDIWGCLGSSFTFAISPEDDVLYSCDMSTWYDASGVEAVAGIPQIYSYGYGGYVFAGDDVVEIYTGAASPVAMPAGTITTARAQPDGFWVVLERTSSTELWHVGFDGAASRLSTYGPRPADVYSRAYSGAIDASGNLLEFAMTMDDYRDVMLRRTTGGSVDVVYDEADDPIVKLHSSALMTGP